MNTDLEEVILRLSVAAALGLVVGWEREHRDKPAGFRTHALVALGAASFMVITLELVLGVLQYAPDVRPDPTRIIQGVIGGIGFLGAGSIIQSRGDVKGLTTGASIWSVGAIGIACGSGLFEIAGVIAVITLVLLIAMGHLSHWIEQRSKH